MTSSTNPSRLLWIAVEKKFAVNVTYNGVTRPIEVQPEQQVSALLAKAIAAFGISQNQHLLSLFRENGTVVPENESVERAGLKPDEVLLLRPNAVKGGERRPLRLAVNVLGESFQTFHECGRGECECAVYWTGPAGEDLIDSFEHPVHARSRFGYEIDSVWLTEFWKSLAGLKRSIKAQVHTHPGRAFHSRTDDQWPIISQAGFLSIVIPDFAAGKATLDRAWIGSLEPNGSWRQISSADQAFVSEGYAAAISPSSMQAPDHSACDICDIFPGPAPAPIVRLDGAEVIPCGVAVLAHDPGPGLLKDRPRGEPHGDLAYEVRHRVHRPVPARRR